MKVSDFEKIDFKLETFNDDEEIYKELKELEIVKRTNFDGGKTFKIEYLTSNNEKRWLLAQGHALGDSVCVSTAVVKSEIADDDVLDFWNLFDIYYHYTFFDKMTREQALEKMKKIYK